MRNQLGLRTKLYDHHNPDLFLYSEKWFREVYERVLKSRIGKGTLVQTGAAFYGVFNTDWYSEQKDVASKSSSISYYLKKNHTEALAERRG